MEQLHPNRCASCDQTVQTGATCGNPLCGRSVELRGWEYIWAIAMRSGHLKSVISAYKYNDVKGWSWIFGRILVGYLERHIDAFDTFDVIIPTPTFIGPGGRSWDHVGTIIERAEVEGPLWPFRRDIMSKTAPTHQWRHAQPRVGDQQLVELGATLGGESRDPAGGESPCGRRPGPSTQLA